MYMFVYQHNTFVLRIKSLNGIQHIIVNSLARICPSKFLFECRKKPEGELLTDD